MKRALAITLVLALGCGAVLVRRAAADPPKDAKATAAEPAAPSPEAPPASVSVPIVERASEAPPEPDDPELARVRAARVIGDERALVLALDHADPIVQLEAIDALEERACTRCLRDLVRIDVRRDARVGATVIAAIGALAKKANAPERRLAVDRLTSLLASERRREGPEADANVLGVIEALGALDDDAGRRALEKMLDDPGLDVVTQIVVIRSLGPHPSDGARQRLVAIRRERSAERVDDDFEQGLRRELDEAIAASLGG